MYNAALLGTKIILRRALGISESESLSDVRARFLISNGDAIIKK